MFCPKCGKELEEGDPFCPYCGSPLKKEEPPFFLLPKRSRRRVKNWTPILIIALLFLIGGIASYFFLINPQQGTPSIQRALIPRESGGVLELPSGARLEIPPGALTSDSWISFSTSTATPPDLPPGLIPVGPSLVVEGAQGELTGTATLVFPIPKGEIPQGLDASFLVPALYEEGQWLPLIGELDEEESRMVVVTPHFSLFQLFVLDLADIHTLELPQLEGWYPGTTHVHSNYSDGLITVKGAAWVAQKAGLKWFGLTDHSWFYAQKRLYWLWHTILNESNWIKRAQEVEKAQKETGVFILQGQELCTRENSSGKSSHLLGFGLKGPVVDYSMDPKGKPTPLYDGQELIDRVRDKGGYSILAHPASSSYPWTWKEAQGFAGMEVLAFADLTANPQALEYWDSTLCQRLKGTPYQVAGVGGADLHGEVYLISDPLTAFAPFTYLKVDGEPTVAKLEEALKQGRAICSARGSVVTFTLSQEGGEQAEIGETFTLNPQDSLILDISWEGARSLAESPIPNKPELLDLRLVVGNQEGVSVFSLYNSSSDRSPRGGKRVVISPGEERYPHDFSYFRLEANFGSDTLIWDSSYTNPIWVKVPEEDISQISSKFQIGDRVRATENLNAREEPSTKGKTITVMSKGSTGTISSNCTFADNFYWWKVKWDSGVEGWCPGELLELYYGTSSGGPEESQKKWVLILADSLTVLGGESPAGKQIIGNYGTKEGWQVLSKVHAGDLLEYISTETGRNFNWDYPGCDTAYKVKDKNGNVGWVIGKWGQITTTKLAEVVEGKGPHNFTPVSFPDVSGEWTGTITEILESEKVQISLTLERDDSITFHGTGVLTKGDETKSILVGGSLNGNSIYFVEKHPDGSLWYYSGTISEDGKKIEGFITTYGLVNFPIGPFEIFLKGK